MNFYSFRFWIWLIGSVWLGSAQADVLEKNTHSLSNLKSIHVFEDKQGQWGFDQASHTDNAALYQAWAPERGQINMGFSQSTYWVRIRLSRAADAPATWVLEVPFFQLSQVDFYAPGQPAVQTGAEMPLSTRPFLHRFLLSPWHLTPSPRTFICGSAANTASPFRSRFGKSSPFATMCKTPPCCKRFTLVGCWPC